MKFIKHPMFRKAMFLAMVACAALACAEVYQRFFVDAAKPVEEVLLNIGAQKMLVQTITVNGQNVLASTWKLPDYQSANPIRKAKGEALIVGSLVFTFDTELKPLRGECQPPDDFPQLTMDCEYLMDTTQSRALLGVSSLPPRDLQAQLAAWAQANGWEQLFGSGGTVLKKGNYGLSLQASESKRGTEVTIVIIMLQVGPQS